MEIIAACFQIVWPGFSMNVDLTLPGKGVTAIFGQSGSGKTTLLRCIAGLERASKGFLSFKGEVWQDENSFLPVHQRPLGYVFQEASLFPHLSVLKNLRYGQTRSKSEQKVSLDQAIELLGISHLLERMPERLSGGERQRVAIARALAVSPRILLMDEPLAALDLARKQEILPYLERLHDELELPILYVTHSPDEVARLADHLVALKEGCLLGYGPLSETLARLDLPIRLGEERAVVLEGTVVERDDTWHLIRVAFNGGSLWTRDRGIAVGKKVRLRVPSGGVSLALQPQHGTSILNSLSGTVAVLADDEHPGLALVQVKIGASLVLARITKRSLDALGLQPGQQIWVQVKSVAVLE
jgi:molybdate transport system ATP-binding protein